MSERAIKYLEIATQQLEDALYLYFDKNNYISAITLAGASEEILGVLAKHIEGKNSLGKHVDLTLELNEIFQMPGIDKTSIINKSNHWRNKAKHLDAPNLAGVIMDDKEVAEDILARAIDNYGIVSKDLSPMMSRFQDEMQNAV